MNDTAYIIGLMSQNTDALGFIPKTTLQSQYIDNGRYLLQKDLRGRTVGYLLHGSFIAGSVLSISQAVIDFDFRNRGFGEMEVLRLIERAKQQNCREIKLRCADNLEANLFWQAMGFELVNTLAPDNRRQRLINVYMLPLWSRLL